MDKASTAIAAFILLLVNPLVALANQVRATIVYDDVATEVSAIDGNTAQLWVSTVDLTRALAFAQLVDQPVAHDEALATWYFGLRSDQREGLSSLRAPDFTLPDTAGKMHSLSDFRGKKVLLVTWASW